MKKYEFKIKFEEKYYNLVRNLIDNYYNYKVFGKYNGKGIFKSNIIVNKEDNGYTSIWFKCKSDKLNLESCKKVLYELEKFKIIEILQES